MQLNDSRANLIIEHLNRLQPIYGNLTIIETGTIRNVDPEYILGDGHSTHLVAQWVSKNGGNFYSIDLDISIAHTYLKKLGLRKHVNLRAGDSTEILQTFNTPVHLVYLDSGNDADLILSEFKAIENLVVNEGVVIVDDCEPGSDELLKGNAVIPYAKTKGYKVNLKPRQAVIWFN